MVTINLNGIRLSPATLDAAEALISESGEAVEIINIGPIPEPPPLPALLFLGITDVIAFRNKFAASPRSGPTPLQQMPSEEKQPAPDGHPARS
jgi:hypothetical protein